MSELAFSTDSPLDQSITDMTEPVGTSDETLMEQFCSSKEESAMKELIARYELPLFNYLSRYLGNREAAEDVFQATFLQVFLKCGQFDSSKRFKPWLYTVATNQAIDYQRRNKNNPTLSLDNSLQSDDDKPSSTLQNLLASDEMSPDMPIHNREQARLIRKAVNLLPPMLRQTVELVYFEELKYKDAADKLGVPVGTVKSRLHSAMKKLAEYLQNEL